MRARLNVVGHKGVGCGWAFGGIGGWFWAWVRAVGLRVGYL